MARKLILVLLPLLVSILLFCNANSQRVQMEKGNAYLENKFRPHFHPYGGRFHGRDQSGGIGFGGIRGGGGLRGGVTFGGGARLGGGFGFGGGGIGFGGGGIGFSGAGGLAGNDGVAHASGGGGVRGGGFNNGDTNGGNFGGGDVESSVGRGGGGKV